MHTERLPLSHKSMSKTGVTSVEFTQYENDVRAVNQIN